MAIQPAQRYGQVQPRYVQPQPYGQAVGAVMTGTVGYGGAEIPGLCSCLEDTDACLMAWCLPMAVAGRVADVVEPGSYKTGCCCYYVLSCLGAGECYQGCMLSKNLYTAYPKPYSQADCMTGCKLCLCHSCGWTSCCAKTQELRYIKNLRAKGLLRNQQTTVGRRPGPMRQQLMY